MSPAPRRIEDRFELLARLEDHGAGEVWRARDHGLRGRAVTVQLLDALPDGATALPDAMADRLYVLHWLRHPHVLATLHHGLWERRPFVVRDVFEGPSLAAGLAQARASGRALPLPLLAEFFDQACAGVEAAHTRDAPIAHGGLTTRCVLIQRQPGRGFDVRVTDFGLAPASVATVEADVRALGEVLGAMLATDDETRADAPRAVIDVAERAARGAITEVASLRAAAREAWTTREASPGVHLGVPAATSLRAPARPPRFGAPAATSVRAVVADTVFAPNTFPVDDDASVTPALATDETPWETPAGSQPEADLVDAATTVQPPPSEAAVENPWDTRLRQRDEVVPLPRPVAAQTSVHNPWDTRVLQREVHVQFPHAPRSVQPSNVTRVIVVTALVVMATCFAIGALLWVIFARRAG